MSTNNTNQNTGRKLTASETIRALAAKRCAKLRTSVKTTEGDTITMHGIPSSGEYTGETLVQLASEQKEDGKLRVKPENAPAGASTSGSILPADMPLFVGLAVGTVATDSPEVLALIGEPAAELAAQEAEHARLADKLRNEFKDASPAIAAQCEKWVKAFAEGDCTFTEALNKIQYQIHVPMPAPATVNGTSHKPGRKGNGQTQPTAPAANVQ